MRLLRRLKRRWLVYRGKWIIAGDQTSITPSLPAGTQDGDLMVLIVNGREPITWIHGEEPPPEVKRL